MPDFSQMTMKELGEQKILQLLHRFCPQKLIGDDGALLTPKPGYELVITNDLLIDGVHFSDRTTSSKDIGWRAAAVNLSDLAAMGAYPIGITIGLALPPSLTGQRLEHLYQGLSDCLNKFGGVILGGDITRSPTFMVSVTALGQVKPSTKILRKSAQIGDAIVVTGWHGAARAGLEALLNPDWGMDFNKSIRSKLILAHQRPTPRLDVLNNIASLPEGCIISGMDSSDGLADAVLQICRASQVGAEIEGKHLPIHPALLQTQSITSRTALDWALYGGEDFELVLTMKQNLAEMLVQQLGNGAAIIGHITSSSTVKLHHQKQIMPLSLQQGFQHWSTEGY